MSLPGLPKGQRPIQTRIEDLWNRLKLEGSILNDKLNLLSNLVRADKSGEWTEEHEKILKQLEKP